MRDTCEQINFKEEIFSLQDERMYTGGTRSEAHERYHR